MAPEAVCCATVIGRPHPHIFLAGLLAAGACTTADDVSAEAEETSRVRLGRVEVDVVAARSVDGPEADAPEATVTASARFVEIVDDDAGHLSAWLGLGDDPWTAGVADGCRRVVDGVPTFEDLDAEVFGGEAVFLDAGDLEIQVGDARFEVPVHLVPDLLPFVSGVEYVLGAHAVPVDGGAMRVEVAGGAADEGVEPFRFAVAVEPVRDLVVLPGDDGALWLAWARPTREGGRVFVEIEDASSVEEGRYLCTFADDGDARIDAEVLADLDREGSWSVSVARLSRSSLDGPDEHTEFVVVTKTTATVDFGG
ncbi:MAG: hypothetical protein D6705_09595 [Deltaproteobacteria bacterium]|nr:MAG: hypothetical protein D6705_09595 [Deltaproteobacteria bacterium]